MANPDFNPRGDAILVATYAQQLDQESATQVFSSLLTQLSSMNEENRNYFIQLAEKVRPYPFVSTIKSKSRMDLMFLASLIRQFPNFNWLNKTKKMLLIFFCQTKN